MLRMMFLKLFTKIIWSIMWYGYVNEILNTLIPKDDILHRIEKNTTEHSKKIKSLESQIEDLKKENQVLKEILTSKRDFNENNIANNNIDDTWNMAKANEIIMSITKSATGDLIALMSVININLFLSGKTK